MSTLDGFSTDKSDESINNGNDDNAVKSNLEFEVEAIVDHHIKLNGIVEYLLKWKGFGKEENSWVNEEDVNAPSLIRLYWSNRNPVKRKSKGTDYPPRRLSRNGSSRNAKNRFENQRESDSKVTDIIQETDGSNSTGKDDNVHTINDDGTDGGGQNNIDEIPKWLQTIGEESKGANDYFTPYAHNNWENFATILNVVREVNIDSDTSDIFVHIKWPDGTDSYFISSEVYQKCPLKLIQFYEQHLVFKE